MTGHPDDDPPLRIVLTIATALSAALAVVAALALVLRLAGTW